MNATKMFLFVKSFHRHRNQSGLFSFIVSYPSVSVYAKLKLLVFLCFSEMRARSVTKKVRFETMQIFRVCLFKFRWHPFILISFRFVSFFIRPVSISHIPFSDSFSCFHEKWWWCTFPFLLVYCWVCLCMFMQIYIDGNNNGAIFLSFSSEEKWSSIRVVDFDVNLQMLRFGYTFFFSTLSSYLFLLSLLLLAPFASPMTFLLVCKTTIYSI